MTERNTGCGYSTFTTTSGVSDEKGKDAPQATKRSTSVPSLTAFDKKYRDASYKVSQHEGKIAKQAFFEHLSCGISCAKAVPLSWLSRIMANTSSLDRIYEEHNDFVIQIARCIKIKDKDEL